MGKKGKTFQIGDLVFAKVKGYPPWPARITKITASKKYNVYFYGTGETANIKIEDLFNYVDSKAKFATEKQMKKNNFREAIEQIEAALQGDDPAPLNIANISQQNVSCASEVDTENVDNKSQVDESNDDVNATVTDASTVADDTNDEQFNINTSSLTLTKNDYQDVMKTSTPMITTNKEGGELVSRSGRKIKPKRYLDEDEIQTPPSKRQLTTTSESGIKLQKNDEDINNEISSTKSKIKSKKLNNLVSHGNNEDEHDNEDGVDKRNKFELPTEHFDNVLLAVLPDGRCVGINLDCNKPEQFENDEEKKKWFEENTKAALDIKDKLQSGTIDIETVKHMLDMNPQIPDYHLEKMKLDKKVLQSKILTNERNIINLNAKIRSSSSLAKADVDLCLILLKSFSELKVTPLILKKHPSCVETMKKLRKYVGNTKSWDMSSEEEVKFQEKAEKIREHAELIYNNFKKMFVIPDGKNFLDVFNEEVKEFKKKTEHMTSDEVLLLIDEDDIKPPETTASTIDENKNKTLTENENENEHDNKKNDVELIFTTTTEVTSTD